MCTLAPPAGRSVLEVGEWLAGWAVASGRGEAGWLAALAEWDRDQGWAADGLFSGVEWLVARAKLSRPTAYEKLRVAHELERRPVVKAAFAAGRVSYSAVRVIARAVGAEPTTDQALVAVAEAGSVLDVDRAVRAYLLHADQDRPPLEPEPRRGVRMVANHDGTTTVTAVLGDLEAAELGAALDAVMAVDEPVAGPETGDDAVYAGAYVPVPPGGLPGWGERRADALVELARRVPGTSRGDGGDRYMVHLVLHAGAGGLLGGEPLDHATLAAVGCDASTAPTVLGEGGEVLFQGRRSRTWNTAQRRAVLVRDGGRCRWPGCERRHVDVHHVQWWEHGGPTDVDNGCLLCPRHHTLVHRGWSTSGCRDGPLTFWRPDGTPAGTTRPAAAPLVRCS